MKLLQTNFYQIYSKTTSKNLYIKIFNAEKNVWLPGKSSKKSDLFNAEKVALSWVNGENESNSSIINGQILNLLKSANAKNLDAFKICSFLKQQGLILNFILPKTKSDIKAKNYFLDFVNPQKSDYLKEKERMAHPLCKSTLKNNFLIIKKYYLPFLGEKFLSEITKSDLREFIDFLQTKTNLSNVTKRTIVSVGFKIFRWAYKTELLEKDITAGLKNFCAKANERKILTPKIIEKLFLSEWKNQPVKIANLLSFCTGMRAGEIVALKVSDIGENCIYLKHSYSIYDGLKSTKSGKSRIVYIYEKKLLQKLKNLNQKSVKNPDEYIFCSLKNKNKPLRTETLLRSLKRQLLKIGCDKEFAKKITFHAWRHFHDTYLNGKIDLRILQNQAGHSRQMIENLYANHERETDKEELFTAQKKIFGKVLKEMKL